jgi:hypothetical protein
MIAKHVEADALVRSAIDLRPLLPQRTTMGIDAEWAAYYAIGQELDLFLVLAEEEHA